jgi:hypothetical protein
MKRGPQRLHGTIFVVAKAVDNAPDGCSVVETDPGRHIPRMQSLPTSDHRASTASFEASPVEQVREDLGLLNRIIESVMRVLTS